VFSMQVTIRMFMKAGAYPRGSVMTVYSKGQATLHFSRNLGKGPISSSVTIH